MHGADCGTGDGLTAALLEGRRQAGQVLARLRQAAGDDAAVRAGLGLVGLAPMPGVRESRHVRCRHRLDGMSLLTGVQFPDGIAHGTYPVDIHHADRGGVTLRYLDGTERIHDGTGSRTGRWRPEGERTPFYSIPFRCLVPAQGAANLLAAGRCVDADPEAFGAIRVMVTCLQMGEAAGAAAALAGDGAPSDLDAGRLRADLKSHGAALID